MLYCCYLCTFVKLVMRNKDIYIVIYPYQFISIYYIGDVLVSVLVSSAVDR